jgi:hypothetical protein
MDEPIILPQISPPPLSSDSPERSSEGPERAQRQNIEEAAMSKGTAMKKEQKKPKKKR